ncbi:MAG TPA: methyltransferase domain-containing protein [Gaiellaceae bacterium]|nr:methyltransferase domain-containing protein [Gaiellaceae bacterium]
MSVSTDTLLAEILACPVCHGELEDGHCRGCGRTYEDADFIPHPLPDSRLRRRRRLWQKLEANGARAYELDPPSSLSVGERDDARRFAEFAQLEGLILDVGCGPQALPSYAEGVAERFVGIDPLRGEPRGFAFAQAIAEYLPFRDSVFDRVLFATTIDHLLLPELALAEARRVGKPGGTVSVWLGEANPPPPPSDFRDRLRRRLRIADVTTPRVTMRFRVPVGAADPFHVAHPTAAQVEDWLERAGLHVVELQRPMPQHCFIRAVVP